MMALSPMVPSELARSANASPLVDVRLSLLHVQVPVSAPAGGTSLNSRATVVPFD